MGAIISSLLSWLTGSSTKVAALGEDADVPDPATGLTPRNVADIRSTWELVKPDMRHHGVQFFLLFFKEVPSTQLRFKSFRNVPLEELKDNKRLAAHGSTVFGAIDSYISNLDDADCVVEMLQTSAHNHKARGITVKDYESLPPVLIKYLKDSLGSAWSSGAEEGWEKLLGVIIKVVTSVY